MRKDKALAKELQAIVDGLHDPTVSDDPFVCSDGEGERSRRSDDLRRVREKLSSFVYVSRARKITKLLVFGTLLPLAALALLVSTNVPATVELRLASWGGLVATAIVFGVVAVAVWWRPSIDKDISYAFYAIPRGWSFSRRNGHATWKKLRDRFSYFDRGDDDQSITTRIWGFLDEGKQRPLMMFAFHWVDVKTRTRYNSQKKKMETYKERIPHDRHGMFVAMPESKARIRITEVGGSGGLDEPIRLEYGALNKAVDVHCHGEDELAVRQFLSPAVQEVMLELSGDLPGMHLDFYPGSVLVVSSTDFLDGARRVRLDRDAPRFEEPIRSWIDEVETFRTNVGERLHRIAKYND